MYYFIPMLVAVCSNIFYNIAAKSTSENINPFACLVIIYGVALTFSIALFFVTSHNQNLLTEFTKTNWAAIGMGLSIVGVEVGYLFMYRGGWAISSASIVTNILLAIALLFVGILFYKEHISFCKVIGILMCMGGLVFINKG